MNKQLSFVVDGTRMFTAFGAEGLLADALGDSNVIAQKTLSGSAALTRSYNKLVGGDMRTVPILTVTSIEKNGAKYIVTGTHNGVEYVIGDSGINDFSDPTVPEPKKGIIEEPTETGQTVDDLLGNETVTGEQVAIQSAIEMSGFAERTSQQESGENNMEGLKVTVSVVSPEEAEANIAEASNKIDEDSVSSRLTDALNTAMANIEKRHNTSTSLLVDDAVEAANEAVTKGDAKPEGLTMDFEPEDQNLVDIRNGAVEQEKDIGNVSAESERPIARIAPRFPIASEQELAKKAFENDTVEVDGNHVTYHVNQQELEKHVAELTEKEKAVRGSNMAVIGKSDEQRTKSTLRELLSNAKEGGLVFGKREPEAVATQVTIGGVRDTGFLYQANIRQPNPATPRVIARREVSVTGRQLRHFTNAAVQSGTVSNVGHNQITQHIATEHPKIVPEVVTKEQQKPELKTGRVTQPSKTWRGITPKVEVPENAQVLKSDNMEWNDEARLKGLFNGQQEGTKPVEEKLPEPPKQGVKIYKGKSEVNMPELEGADVASKEEELSVFLAGLDDAIATVLQKVPSEIISNTMQQYTSHNVNVEQLNSEGFTYCIDNHWYKCGDWYGIDVLPTASRYIYNQMLGVSIEIPRAVHKKYYELTN